APSIDAAPAADPHAGAAADPAAAAQAPADPAAQAAVADPAAAQPGAAPAAAAKPGRRNYWTNFRGPSRDGRYDEQPIRTNWEGGLQQLWKQPSGGGYASFSVADGVAYTIEQRRGQEVVAAYNIDN